MIERKTAEAARRRALEIAAPFEGSALNRPELEEERRECVRTWNAFCLQEQRRLDAKRDPKVAVYETYRKLGWA